MFKNRQNARVHTVRNLLEPSPNPFSICSTQLETLAKHPQWDRDRFKNVLNRTSLTDVAGIPESSQNAKRQKLQNPFGIIWWGL